MNNNSTATKEYLIRFPPFPSIPSGAIIIPFSEYKESGIMIAPGGNGTGDINMDNGDGDGNNNDNDTSNGIGTGTEVDGYGIATIVLASSHTTDWCKTNTKRQKYNQEGRMGGFKKRRKRKSGAGGGSGPNGDDWEEYWEDREARYRINAGYDPLSEPFERFYAGAFDFKNGRPWPIAQKQRGPVYVWGEFCRFTGIPTGPGSDTTPAPKKEKEKVEGNDSDFDDDDDDDNAGILHPSNLVAADVMLKAQAKAESFLKDPAQMLKIFLSSYARDRGIIWTKENLRGAPVLIQFFIHFLINNHILPKREENAIKHDSTQRVLEMALKELPLTAEIARAWPDDFSRACKDTWGSRAEVYKFRGLTPEPVQEPNEVPPPPADEGWIHETREGNENGWGTTKDDGDEKNGRGGGNDGNNDDVELEWSTGGGTNGWEGTVVSGVEEIKEVDETTAPTTEADEVVQATIENVKASSALTQTTTEDEALTWVYKPSTFFQILGPTALPLTHTPGIVESSVRRIKAVHPVSTDPAKFPVTKDISPDAVEGALRKNFGIVVFEPWLNWNHEEEGGEHLSNPRILDTSKGLVVPEYQNPSIAQDPPVTSTLPTFDPSKDEISVIVGVEHLKYFSVGMGCHCTWVQLARVEDFQPQQPGKKKKKNAKMDRYWYVEESLLVVPSYYATAP